MIRVILLYHYKSECPTVDSHVGVVSLVSILCGKVLIRCHGLTIFDTLTETHVVLAIKTPNVSVCVCVYIYIYIYRERERESEREYFVLLEPL